MNLEDRARRLVDHLQTVMEEAEAVDKRNSAVREKLSWQEIRVLRPGARKHSCTMNGLDAAICL